MKTTKNMEWVDMGKVGLDNKGYDGTAFSDTRILKVFSISIVSGPALYLCASPWDRFFFALMGRDAREWEV